MKVEEALGREANLTWSNSLQKENEIIEGNWHGNVETQYSEGWFPVSVEEGVAERLDIEMGDRLTFNVGSEIVETKVTSIRTVNWQTMQPNSFLLFIQMRWQRSAQPISLVSICPPIGRLS